MSFSVKNDKEKNEKPPVYPEVSDCQKTYFFDMRSVSYAFCFSGDMCGGKTHCKRKSPLKSDFQGAWVVLAGVECSPKILRFLANGTSVQERVDFFDTLKPPVYPEVLLYLRTNFYIIY